MLYIVATPIGNLEDITLRALRILKEVAVIYCEDTRRTKLLLNHYGIQTPTESLHHHSGEAKYAEVLNRLSQGVEVAYVTDAGTPGIADPGGILAEKALAAGFKVVPIPGASAVTAHLSAAGFPANQFYFAGYVPTKKGRQTFVKKLLAYDETVVFFETAPRLLKLFDQLAEFGGEQREIVVGRELTKQFEELKRGTVAELKNYYQTNLLKGELVLAIGRQPGLRN